MSRKKRLLVLPAIVLALLAPLIYRSTHREDRLAFLRPYVLYEKVSYFQPDPTAPISVVHKVVVQNLSDEKVATLFKQNLTAAQGWRLPVTERDPPSYLSVSTYHGHPYSCSFAFDPFNTSYQRAPEVVIADRYYGLEKSRYEVFDYRDLSTLQQWWLKLRTFGHIPFEHLGTDVDPQAI